MVEEQENSGFTGHWLGPVTRRQRQICCSLPDQESMSRHDVSSVSAATGQPPAAGAFLALAAGATIVTWAPIPALPSFTWGVWLFILVTPVQFVGGFSPAPSPPSGPISRADRAGAAPGRFCTLAA
jgi:hypothetical protein